VFVDASALTAILLREPEADALATRLERARIRKTSPLAVWETALAVARALDLPPRAAFQDVHEYLGIAGIELLAIPVETAEMAVDAHDRFGKGRHKARLNMGDCFAYACARHFGEPMLYKGDDFAQTDIEAV
jgi:ribonuclease VapC